MHPRPRLAWTATLVLATLPSVVIVASAQNCYYPNGDLSIEGDAPCSSDGGACCPLNWECMSNGLCYLPNEDYYGRYTCTDRSWQSESCPQICTQNGVASGNEALLWCANGDWCCDGNRSFNCCSIADTDFFSLPKPSSIALISATQPVTFPASTNGEQTTTSRSNLASSTSTATTASPVTVTQQLTTLGHDGSTSIITSVVTALPAATNIHSPPSDSSTHTTLPLTLGLVFGILLALVLLALLAIYLYRRHRNHKHRSHPIPSKSPPLEANYQDLAPGTHAPELSGYPVASKSDERKSELYGSEANIRSPSLSLMSNTTPPQYSPGENNTNITKASNMSHIPEEPQELWGGYVPYRRPGADAASELLTK